MKLLLLSSLVLCHWLLAHDETAPPEPELAPSQLVDIFSVSDAPGSGTLLYKLEEGESEKIALGKETGFYGLGMVFAGKVLPEPFKKDFQKNEILQVALGTIRKKDDTRSPQFGAATLLASKIPTEKTTFRLTMPNPAELKKGPTAVLLFSSPNLKTGTTDEEKLKETVFAESGNLVLTPLGKKTTVLIKSGTQKYAFYRRVMKIEWLAQLSTPFATSKRGLLGVTEFPFYWPKDNEAGKLATRIASESLSSVGMGGKGTPPKKK